MAKKAGETLGGDEMWDYFIRIQEDGETLFVDEVTEDDFTVTLRADDATVFSDWAVVYGLRERYPDITFVAIPVMPPKTFDKSVG